MKLAMMTVQAIILPRLLLLATGFVLITNTLFSQTTTFNFTGSTQSYTVPPCITSLTFVVAGADGGGPAGGNGAIITATITVTPGQVVTLSCGGSGNGLSGGFGGGGAGQNANSTTNASFGGGGASSVSIGGVPVIVAGGGGGTGGGTQDASGGNGGCPSGATGISPFGQGGGGATPTSAGAGGPPWISSGFAGNSGSFGQGGAGAIDPCYNNSPGGGGGGGYYGGGGGGSDCFSSSPYGGGGGGGGSSLMPAGATCNSAGNNGPGYITITATNTPVLPTFAPIAPICSGSAFPVLPATSLNGVAGAWSPAPNNLATTTYTFTPAGGICAALPATLTVVVNPNVTPTFTQVAPICAGATLNPLPTTSSNGISGSWAPALNNVATTTYTFTPTPGLCAISTTMTITVNPNVTPSFSPVASICQGGTLGALPTTSLEGITGSWSPALNNTSTTTYTFSPNAGQCAATNILSITVDQNILPTFDQIPAICTGAVLAPLPITSTNSITGAWSPAPNNSATTTYTFTPSAGSCALTTTMSITINPNVLPTFPQVAPICSGEVLNPLPTTSSNGLNGTWLPALNNTSTTTYTFTPDPGICGLTETMTITVNPNILPTFDPIPAICNGDPLNPLPITSLNGIAGAWSPAPNNVATTIYTFTPTVIAGACNLETTLSIVVNPLVDPIFAPIGPICSGAALSLPATSTNAISGSWLPVANNLATTTYTFTPTAVAGACPLSTTLTVDVEPNALPDFVQVAPICAGAPLAPLQTTSTNGITGTWTPAMNNTATTTYTFAPTPVSAGGVCALSNTMSIVVNPNLAPTFDPIAPICEGAILGTLPTTSLEGAEGVWSPAVDNTTTTTYTFIPNPIPNVCLTNGTLTITVNPNITPTFTQIADLCDGDVLNPFPTTSLNGYTGAWSPQPNESATTTYTFDPDPSQCALSTTMEVEVNPLPNPNFTVVQEIGCAPLDATFTNTSVGAIAYQWNFGNGTSSLIENPSATFGASGCFDVTLTATTLLGCTASFTMADAVCVTPEPVAFFSSSLYTLTQDELTNSFFNLSENANWFSWDFGDGTAPVEAYEGSHTFPGIESSAFTVTLTAMNDVGCVDTFSYTYEIAEPLIYFIPNSFTPDGDPFNNTFLPVFTSGFNPLAYNLKIYNRWGEIVFESNDASVGWDGNYGLSPAKTGNYNWVIEFEGIDEDFGSHKLSGSVNLLR